MDFDYLFEEDKPKAKTLLGRIKEREELTGKKASIYEHDDAVDKLRRDLIARQKSMASKIRYRLAIALRDFAKKIDPANDEKPEDNGPKNKNNLKEAFMEADGGEGATIESIIRDLAYLASGGATKILKKYPELENQMYKAAEVGLLSMIKSSNRLLAKSIMASKLKKRLLVIRKLATHSFGPVINKALGYLNANDTIKKAVIDIVVTLLSTMLTKYISKNSPHAEALTEGFRENAAILIKQVIPKVLVLLQTVIKGFILKIKRFLTNKITQVYAVNIFMVFMAVKIYSMLNRY